MTNCLDMNCAKAGLQPRLHYLPMKQRNSLVAIRHRDDETNKVHGDQRRQNSKEQRSVSHPCVPLSG